MVPGPLLSMRSSLVSRTLALLVGSMLLLAPGCTDDTSETGSASPNNGSASTMMDGAMSSSDDTPMPDLTVETMDGTSLALHEQQGKVLLINFWATWCAPCREEIPDLVELQNDLGDDLMVVGVSLDREGASVVTPFIEEYDINYPLVLDTDGTLESTLGPVQALPTTLVVNPEGTITRRVIGLFPTDEMRPKLEAMLEDSAT